MQAWELPILSLEFPNFPDRDSLTRVQYCGVLCLNASCERITAMIRLLILAMLVLVLPLPASAQTTATETFGGRGGGPFRLECPAGMVMTGVRARTGAWIDAVAPVCAIWVASSATLGDIDDQPGTGGNGGGPNLMHCAGRRGAVVGLFPELARNRDGSVGWLRIECADYQHPWRWYDLLRGTATELGQRTGSERPFLGCGYNEVAVGIYGRSGAFIDRIGLLCRRSAAVRPRPLNQGELVRCREGLVERSANRGDRACVPRSEYDRIMRENRIASERVDPRGAYGPKSCVQGFVWREATPDDLVCVTPERRSQVKGVNFEQFGR
jgi:hypothetical protein